VSNALVVEDEETVRNAIAILLREAGHFVMEAKDGRDALRILKIFTPDFVTLDLVMDNIDGMHFLRKLWDNEEPLPILVVSGYSESYAAQACRLMGASNFIRKPLAYSELLTAVEELDIAKSKTD